MAYSDEIMIINVPNVVGAKCDQSLCPSGRGDKLDLESITSVNLDDRAKIAAPKPQFRDVSL